LVAPAPCCMAMFYATAQRRAYPTCNTGAVSSLCGKRSIWRPPARTCGQTVSAYPTTCSGMLPARLTTYQSHRRLHLEQLRPSSRRSTQTRPSCAFVARRRVLQTFWSMVRKMHCRVVTPYCYPVVGSLKDPSPGLRDADGSSRIMSAIQPPWPASTSLLSHASCSSRPLYLLQVHNTL
jgi:hypothetical protein